MYPSDGTRVSPEDQRWDRCGSWKGRLTWFRVGKPCSKPGDWEAGGRGGYPVDEASPVRIVSEREGEPAPKGGPGPASAHHSPGGRMAYPPGFGDMTGPLWEDHQRLLERLEDVVATLEEMREPPADAGSLLAPLHQMIDYLDTEFRSHQRVEQEALFPVVGEHGDELVRLLDAVRAADEGVDVAIEDLREALIQLADGIEPDLLEGTRRAGYRLCASLEGHVRRGDILFRWAEKSLRDEERDTVFSAMDALSYPPE